MNVQKRLRTLNYPAEELSAQKQHWRKQNKKGTALQWICNTGKVNLPQKVYILYLYLSTGITSNKQVKWNEVIWVSNEGEKPHTCGVLVSEVLFSGSSCRRWFILSACSSWCWSCRNCSLGTIGQACCWRSCSSNAWGDGLSITVDFRCCIGRRAKPWSATVPSSTELPLEVLSREQWSLTHG